MKKLLTLLVCALLLPLCAMAQDDLYKYEGEGFTIRLISTVDLRIASTKADVVFDADDDDRKADVDVFLGANMEGYSNTGKEVDDDDFFVNDKGTEMMIEDRSELRSFLRHISRGRASGVSLGIEVVDSTAPKGKKTVFFKMPAEAVKGLLKAYDTARWR